ncbi:MAG TPA: DUF2142 domain-containing protein [Candidatus Saccharibacteria bacterium]|nr:DUF2142 domain-containing protein [Candidatus Saccharibacteria bacterium]HRQ97733.1 DUF2142 domain-containing protein [Candidatus Saccharibacteria bacterium]
MKEKFNHIYSLLTKTLASKRFSWFVVGLFIFQALWVAFSFRFPMIYDEGFHMEATRLFSGHILPVLETQPVSSDIFGIFVSGGATIFHYFMSVPYSIVSWFTDSRTAHVIVLRIIGVIMFAGGIVLFTKLFQKIGIRRIYINIGMLLFILLPVTTLTAATVSYDNMLFLLTPAFLIMCVRILLSKKMNWRDYALLIALGCLASLVKFTFLPIFAAGILFIGIYTLRRWKKSIFRELLVSIQSTKKIPMILIAAILVVSVGVFSSVYIKNTIVYGSPQPSCQELLGEERCTNGGVTARNLNAAATKNTRELQSVPVYLSSWATQMTNWTNMTGSRIQNSGMVIKDPLPVIYATVFIAIFIGAGFMLYSWKLIKKNIAWYFLLTMATVLILSVFVQNTLTYLELHIAYAVQPRYLLGIMPILIIMMAVSAGIALRKHRLVKSLLLVIVFILFSQGGGLVTHILRSDDSWNWNNATVKSINNNARELLRPFVKEY